MSNEEAEVHRRQLMWRLWRKSYRPGAFSAELFGKLSFDQAEFRTRPFHELAAWLSERGDPRGALILLCLRLAAEEGEFLAKEVETLLRHHPEALDLKLITSGDQPTWRAGFVTAGLLRIPDIDAFDVGGLRHRLIRYLQHPSISLLQQLRIEVVLPRPAAHKHWVSQLGSGLLSILTQEAPDTLMNVQVGHSHALARRADGSWRVEFTSRR